jgi:hypothetical protein
MQAAQQDSALHARVYVLSLALWLTMAGSVQCPPSAPKNRQGGEAIQQVLVCSTMGLSGDVAAPAGRGRCGEWEGNELMEWNHLCGTNPRHSHA